MLPTSQLMDLTGQLVALKTCYELTEPEMQKQADCPHCHFNLAENDSKPVHGRLGQIEDKADEVLNGWTNTLKSALEDDGEWDSGFPSPVRMTAQWFHFHLWRSRCSQHDKRRSKRLTPLFYFLP